MKLTEQQNQEIADQKDQEYPTKKVTSPTKKIKLKTTALIFKLDIR